MEQRYNTQICDEQMRQLWQQQQTYRQTKPNFKSYTIDTPPPTVSGSLHIGHIFSYTQTDVIARYKRMNGFSVFYPFGFDDNGLPTERYVEKKRNIRAHELSRSDFIAICIEESLSAAEAFKKLWQKMGLSADWNYVYSTISDQTRKISQESFIDLYQKKYIYRTLRPSFFGK